MSDQEPARPRRFPWKFYLLLFVLIIVIFGAPMWSVIIAATLADFNNCTLHEGFVNPCVIGGVDYGETLYAMGVMGWFGMVTLPLGAIALLIWVAALVIHTIIHFVTRRKPAN